MGFFSDFFGGALNILSDVTGIREISPQRMEEYRFTRSKQRVERARKAERVDMQRRMRSRNARIRSEAQREYRALEVENRRLLNEATRQGKADIVAQQKEHQKTLQRIQGRPLQEGPTGTESTTEFRGKIASLSRLGSAGPLRIPSRDPEIEREQIERRPK